jgi:hypothetical protein
MKHIASNATANAQFTRMIVPMGRHLTTHLIGFGLLGMALTALPAAAQSQASPSTQSTSAAPAAGAASTGSALGDYARQMRKTSAPAAKAKVFDNDNLPKEDKLSVVGTPSQAPVDTAAKTQDTATAAAPAPADANAQVPAGDAKAAAPNTTVAKTQDQDDAAKQAAWKQWGEKINAQKDAIDLAARELDVLQREYQIRAAAMYADVGNRMRNSADWDKQDADYKQKIADKQKAVEDAKQKLDDMQEDARKAGVPASMREPGQQ